jgi:DNA-binding XRE family transcriptional regulator
MAGECLSPVNFSSLPAAIQGLIARLLLVNAPKDVTKEEFKALREALGLSRREMAEILGVSEMTIWRAENHGPNRPTIAYLESALAKGHLRLSDKKARPESSDP